jgi:transposase
MKKIAQKVKMFLGLDVHAETIAVAVAEADGGEVRSLGIIPNRPGSVGKLIRKLGNPEAIKACYEAGPCGYDLYWQLVELGVGCEVVAPTLIPVKAGDRVKTDRRDARKLAQLFRSGELTAAWVPDKAHEALRDIVRAREAAKKDQLRARHRLQKFLLRKGLRPPEKLRAWSDKYMQWVKGLTMPLPAEEAVRLDYVNEVDHAAARIERLERAINEAVDAAPKIIQAVVQALQAFRGLQRLGAATIAAEAGSLSRFERAKQLMGYGGIVSSEDSSGGRTRRGAITKTGNAHLRRIVVEAAWAYRHRPNLSKGLRARQKDLPPEICEIAWKAQHRLHKRYMTLLMKGKTKQQVVVAVGRELLGFIWDVGRRVEAAQASSPAQSPQVARKVA